MGANRRQIRIHNVVWKSCLSLCILLFMTKPFGVLWNMAYGPNKRKHGIMDSLICIYIYIHGTERKEVLLSPLKTPSHLGRTWTKYHQRSKQNLPKDMTDFSAGAGNCLKGSQTCGDTATVSTASGFMSRFIGTIQTTLSLRWLKDFRALYRQQMNLTTHWDCHPA